MKLNNSKVDSLRFLCFVTTITWVLSSQTVVGKEAKHADSSPTATSLDADDAADMSLMNETQAFLVRGSYAIQISEEHRDLTLMLGLSGSGKSTMAQLISGRNGSLEAYSHKFSTLIRDTGKRISHGSNTLVSETLFPELIIDEGTGDALYDCPGFGDTRSTPTEIAIGFFMKKLVEHAQSLKLLVIFKYDALKLGGSRDWFMRAMTQLLLFARNIKEYGGGIALLATKMDQRDSRIKQQIVGFLQEAYPHVLETWPNRREDIDTLFQAWQTQDASKHYVNIEYFKQPELPDDVDTMLLKDMPAVNANRERIRKMIFNNTHFQHQPCNPDDFGIPLSHKALAQIRKLEIKLLEELHQNFNNMSDQVRQIPHEADSRPQLERIPSPETFLEIQKCTKRLEAATAFPDITGAIIDMVKPFGSVNVTASIIKTISALSETLQYLVYLEKLQSKKTKATAEYSGQFRKLGTEVSMTVEKKVRAGIHHLVDDAFYLTNDKIRRNMKKYDHKGKLKALEITAAVLNDCTLNALDFGSCLNRTLTLLSPDETSRFFRKTDSLEKAAKLEMLLTEGEKLNEDLQKASFLRNLIEKLETFGEMVGKEAGVGHMFPRFTEKCQV